ncbi:MAG: EamA-like transporter family protein [Gammaproteobacteria bacterium SG8_11]|nr:MAG: EamA-like transporter family protein [Gammaproteobacteria bacterium SG8_11]
MDWFTLSLICALSLAAADAFTKKFFPQYSGWELLVIRFVVPAALLLPLAFLYPIPSVPAVFWLWIAVLVPLEILAMLLYLLAIRDSPLHLTLPYLAFTPVFNVATGWLVLGETVSPQGLLGIVLVVCGAYLLNIRQLKFGNNVFAPFIAITKERGSRLILSVAAIYSFTSVAGKGAMQYATPESFGAFYYVLIGFVLLVVTVFYQPAKLQVLIRRPAATLFIGLLMAVMVVSHFLALALIEVAYMIAVKRTSLLFGIVLGAVLFKERQLAQHFIAGSLMVIGVALILL